MSSLYFEKKIKQVFEGNTLDVGSHALPFLLFQKVQDYLRRFESIPDMLELDHLTVSGDVTFGKNVSLKVGDLILYVHLGLYVLTVYLNILHLMFLFKMYPSVFKLLTGISFDSIYF